MPIIELRVASRIEADVIFDALEDFLKRLNCTASLSMRRDTDQQTMADLRVEIAGFHAKIADRIFRIARMSQEAIAETRRTLPNGGDSAQAK